MIAKEQHHEYVSCGCDRSNRQVHYANGRMFDGEQVVWPFVFEIARLPPMLLSTRPAWSTTLTELDLRFYFKHKIELASLRTVGFSANMPTIPAVARISSTFVCE
jgi:hypothetical protein